jgi:general secretion pathway protein K
LNGLFARPSLNRRGEKGLALVGVLWLVVILATLAGAVALLSRNDSLVAKASLEDARAEGLADAGFYLALSRFCDPKTARTMAVNGEATTITIDGHDVTVTIQDEAGKLDLNFAARDLLAALLSAEGVSDAAGMADAIEQARDKRPFRAIEELKSIAGITDALMQRLRPWLTLYSQRPTVDAGIAPKEVLAILPGMDAQKITAVVESRQQKGPALGEMVAQQGLGQRIFTITARAQSGRVQFVRRAIIRITGNPQQPYTIYEWTMVDR